MALKAEDGMVEAAATQKRKLPLLGARQVCQEANTTFLHTLVVDVELHPTQNVGHSIC